MFSTVYCLTRIDKSAIFYRRKRFLRPKTAHLSWLQSATNQAHGLNCQQVVCLLCTNPSSHSGLILSPGLARPGRAHAGHSLTQTRPRDGLSTGKRCACLHFRVHKSRVCWDPAERSVAEARSHSIRTIMAVCTRLAFIPVKAGARNCRKVHRCRLLDCKVLNNIQGILIPIIKSWESRLRVHRFTTGHFFLLPAIFLFHRKIFAFMYGVKGQAVLKANELNPLPPSDAVRQHKHLF